MSLFVFFGMAAAVTLVSTIYLSVAIYHHFTTSAFWINHKKSKLEKIGENQHS